MKNTHEMELKREKDEKERLRRQIEDMKKEKASQPAPIPMQM